MEAPIFPVANAHPDRSIRADDFRFDAQPVVLDLDDRDAAGDVGAFARAVAEDFQLIHRERENDVALAQIIEAPATEQVREVIDDDEVGVEPRRLDRP